MRNLECKELFISLADYFSMGRRETITKMMMISGRICVTGNEMKNDFI